MGGVTGAVGGAATGGLGSLIGSEAASGAESAVGNVATNTGKQAVVQSALNESPTAITSQGLGTAANAPTIGTPAVPTAPPVAPTAAPDGIMGSLGSAVKKAAAPQLLNAAGALMGGGQPVYDNSGQQKIAAANEEGQSWANEIYKPLGKAKGGAIHLRDGDFIIPADVVSAIGNGSTKAGAEYLDHLFNALRAGPKPKAGTLAKRRAKERHVA